MPRKLRVIADNQQSRTTVVGATPNLVTFRDEFIHVVHPEPAMPAGRIDRLQEPSARPQAHRHGRNKQTIRRLMRREIVEPTATRGCV
jgi:hypothetical protein